MKLSDYIVERAAGRAVYMPYLTLGDPSYEQTVEFAVAMIDAGADVLELGIPFSDPTADGPVIQAAMVRALAGADFSMEKIFATVGEIHRARPKIPLVFLSYMNPILNGLTPEAGRIDFSRAPAERLSYDAAAALRTFLEHCEAAGIRGLVIPDLPFDAPESEILRAQGAVRGIDQILMVAPNTDSERLEAICQAARGFIYYVTSMGVTGMRAELPPDLRERLDLVKRRSGLPVMAGFGFSHPDQVRGLLDAVDGIIVGSLNHRIIEEHGASARDRLAELTRGFVDVCHAGSGAAAPG